MSFIIENLPESIKATKAELRAALPQYINNDVKDFP